MPKNAKANRLANFICGENASDICRLAIAQLVETMEETCRRCMGDRRTLILDPLCKNRFYLSLLVEAGVPKTEYPLDCYTIRLEETRKVLEGRPNPLPVKDAVIRLGDFIKILSKAYRLKIPKEQIKVSDPEKIKELLVGIASERKNIYLSTSDKKLYLLVETKKGLLINLLDLDLKIAYVNLKERLIEIDSIDKFFESLLQIYNLQGEIYATPPNNIYLKIELQGNIEKEKLDDLLVGLDYMVRGEKKKFLLVRIAELGRPIISYEEIFDLIRSIRGKEV